MTIRNAQTIRAALAAGDIRGAIAAPATPRAIADAAAGIARCVAAVRAANRDRRAIRIARVRTAPRCVVLGVVA
jgi:hypothetical protein